MTTADQDNEKHQENLMADSVGSSCWKIMWKTIEEVCR
jgi:hypothetical protein